jgi:5-methyltetrahydrofolate--homocysteine methyltransferase
MSQSFDEEKLKHHIIDGEKIGLEDNLKKALENYPALEIVNDILLDGMKVVGDLFGSGANAACRSFCSRRK